MINYGHYAGVGMGWDTVATQQSAMLLGPSWDGAILLCFWQKSFGIFAGKITMFGGQSQEVAFNTRHRVHLTPLIPHVLQPYVDQTSERSTFQPKIEGNRHSSQRGQRGWAAGGVE